MSFLKGCLFKMSFQNIANQTTAQIAGAVTTGKFVGQQKEGLAKQQEGLVKQQESLAKQQEALDKQQRAEQLQKAQLTLNGYQQGLKDQQSINEKYKEANEAADKAYRHKNYADFVKDIAEQDKDIIINKYNRQAKEALANNDHRMLWYLAGKKRDELATKYDPYVRAQEAAESAYNDASTRFDQISEQRDVIEKRMQILKEQKDQAYKTIENIYEGGNK